MSIDESKNWLCTFGLVEHQEQGELLLLFFWPTKECKTHALCKKKAEVARIFLS